MPKRSIRTKFLAERRARTQESCVRYSMEIQQRFLSSDFYHAAKCLALYSAINCEVLTDTVMTMALESGKALTYPRVRDDDLEFVQVLGPKDLAPGTFGVLEPQGIHVLTVEELDLVVVPGVAFDQIGHRLGYGRGYYDRALSLCRQDCAKIGFAYESQLLALLPSAEHDQKLSALITETRTLNFIA